MAGTHSQLLLRKICVMLMLVLGSIVVITGLALFFLFPEGPHYGCCRYLGFSKSDYVKIHEYAAFALIPVVLVHIYLNRKAILYYFGLKSPKK